MDNRIRQVRYNLIEAVEESGLQRKQLSRAADVPLSTLGKYLNDGVVPNAITAARLARTLGTTVERIWGEEC